MRFLKYSLIFCFLSASVKAFDSNSCLKGDFTADITRKGALFGLLEYQFKLNKNRCKIRLDYKRYWHKKYEVDICREPVHIKFEQFNNLEIYKKKGRCRDHSDEYCSKVDELLAVIQDDGLIFAEGERDTLESSHGQVYCGFLLLKKYLSQSRIMGMNDGKGVSLEDTSNLSQMTPQVVPKIEMDSQNQDKIDVDTNTSNSESVEKNDKVVF